jgi:hypothetical protein
MLQPVCDLVSFTVFTKYVTNQSYVSLSAVKPLIIGIIIATHCNPADSLFAVRFERDATKQQESRLANLFSVHAPLGDNTGLAQTAVKATAVNMLSQTEVTD